MMQKEGKRLAILGGGPSGLFMFKRLVEAAAPGLSIDVFEASTELGNGMPYSREGANREHITNVSGNEIPELVTSLQEWIQTVPEETLQPFGLSHSLYSDYKVLPRLLFGQYLSEQFGLLKQRADVAGLITNIHLNSRVTNIEDNADTGEVVVTINGQDTYSFHQIIICTGHFWPKPHEGRVPGYFDSPYPPSKLELKLDHPVAVRGASLTAIDAVRTLARSNGRFEKDEKGKLSYQLNEESSGFRMVMHSRNGLLPAIRFHLEDPHLSKSFLAGRRELNRNRAQNEGFLSLDYIFEKDFKEPLQDRDPQFYERIKDMSIEEFVDSMMELRERLDPFVLFKAEYAEAEQSIRRHESVHWKEMLAILSFAMNYPAKHFSAEDMQRLQKVLMPLISIVIAFVPQSSCVEMIALHEGGYLDLVAVGPEGEVEAQEEGGIRYQYTDDEGAEQDIRYQTFVDCIGQPHLSYDDFPFTSLREDGVISPATLLFRSDEAGAGEQERGNKKVYQDDKGNYVLRVPGIRIDDRFRVVDEGGKANGRIYVMAVPFIGGYNPDYSGLDFGEEASGIIIKSLLGD